MTGTIQPILGFARGSVLDGPTTRGPRPRAVESRPGGPKWRGVAALAAAIGLGATAFVVAQDEHSADPTPVLESPVVQPPAVEPAVAAADLPLGSMYHLVDQIGARSLWAQGITGAGVNVAVIDTGTAPVDGLLDDGKVVAAIDLSTEAGDPLTALRDTNGHGTFMAGVTAGRETGADPARSAEHPEWFLGVAPDAGIVSIKVGARNGAVVPGGLAAAVDWAVAHADEQNIRVINLSVGSSPLIPADQDPLLAAVQRAWDAGIVVVAAAGNLGADSTGLSAPASNPYVIAVGGAEVDEAGVHAADWTSAGDGVRNPDLAAPGAHLQSLRVPGSDADVNHPEGFVDEETFQGSGTSQSSAVVAGAAALLLSQRPELTNDQVKALLTSSATPMAESAELVGAGLLDVAAAAATVAPATVQDFPRSATASSLTVQPVEVPVVNDVWAGATWWGATWWGATWWGATWWGATWWGATWWGATWWGATWWGATWWGATWW